MDCKDTPVAIRRMVFDTLERRDHGRDHVRCTLIAISNNIEALCIEIEQVTEVSSVLSELKSQNFLSNPAIPSGKLHPTPVSELFRQGTVSQFIGGRVTRFLTVF